MTSGTFQRKTTTSYSGRFLEIAMQVGDLAGDLKGELILSNSRSKIVTVFRNGKIMQISLPIIAS
jgi:hypothetical protein